MNAIEIPVMDVTVGDVLRLADGELLTVTATDLTPNPSYHLSVRIVGRRNDGGGVCVEQFDRDATVTVEAEPLNNEQFDAIYDTAHLGICQLIQQVRNVVRHKSPTIVEASWQGPDAYLLRIDSLLSDLVRVEHDLRMAYGDLATAGDTP